ncbi:hypothetical protein SPI_04816 [Niveomyces insectorum RCEF 264]|uniref:Uncharacterized protein n=1 Tax=Niveomyces insectorum RCEF 264 TaxID=1081102 RepID=A0A167UVU3_9HYPO|nr:hypothetical protein SPI_04816 [Niveomyces insectorum RCEF 264]
MLAAIARATDDNLLEREVLSGGRVIERYNGITIVQDANVDVENREERFALLAELQAQGAPPIVNLAAVNERLQALPRGSQSPSEASTVPAESVDEETRNAEMRAYEAKHRTYLLQHGCPPCHPPEYTYPYDSNEDMLRRLPAALYYWFGDGGKSMMPLDAQVYDWHQFLKHQTSDRRSCSEEPNPRAAWSHYVLKDRNLLRANKLPESAVLLATSLDLRAQSRFQTWLEFQVYHVRRYAQQAKAAKQKVDAEADEEGRRLVRTNQDRLLALHRGLLGWIEEQRSGGRVGKSDEARYYHFVAAAAAHKTQHATARRAGDTEAH